MSADLPNHPLVQDDDAVGVLDGRKAMRNDDGRVTRQQAGYRVLNLRVGLWVDAGGRLVENQDAGVVRQRPGEADELPLAPRQRIAMLAERSLIPLPAIR